MIDVPVQVKDALRDGRLRKNYRFRVFHYNDVPEWEEIDHFVEGHNSSFVPLDSICKVIYKDLASVPAGVSNKVRLQPNFIFNESKTIPMKSNLESRSFASFAKDRVHVSLATGGEAYLYKCIMPNKEEVYDFTIDNNNLVSESVSIDERMCSGDTLIFGLCEGSSLEFQYFDKPSIAGKRVQAFIDVDYGEAEPYTIPMGFFDVKKCSRQASTGIIKVTAYNKLQSDYLDAKANDLLLSDLDNPSTTLSIYDIRDILLNGYEIKEKEYTKVPIEMPGGYWTPKMRKLSGGGIIYKARYGIDSPLNFHDTMGSASTSSTQPAYLYVEAQETPVDVNINKNYKIHFKYDIDELERWFFSSISGMMDLSFNTDDNTMNRFIDPQPSSGTNYDSYLGWHQLMGIGLQKEDDSIEWYSTIAYQHELSGVVGSFTDLEKKTISGYKKIHFLAPTRINASRSSTNSEYVDSQGNAFRSTLNFVSVNQFGNSYAYFSDSSLENVTERSYRITTPDSTSDYINIAWLNNGWVELLEVDNMTEADQIIINPSELPEFTLREITAASYETQCQFGQLSRLTDLFSGVELNRSALYPADTLYPANSLYPDGAQASSFRSQYSKLWADEGNVHKWRNLIITYKGLDENQQPKDFTLQRQVNADGTDDYNCSDNWLFRNLVWTSEQIAQYAEAMVAKMQPITWFPFEMWAAGLPYLETGDQIEIPLGEETYTSYILQRNLKGIQNLQDTYINGTLDIF